MQRLPGALALTLLCAALLVADHGPAAAGQVAPYASAGAGAEGSSAVLEDLRVRGDLAGQRRHAWAVAARLFGPGDADAPEFESWLGEGEVFATGPSREPRRGIRGFSRAGSAPASGHAGQASEPDFPGAPVFAYALYNPAAYEHIRKHGLNRASRLETLRQEGPADRDFPMDRAIPSFPREAVIIKTVWWPVAGRGVTILPVWDPEDNPPRRSGNSYLQWPRTVSIDPAIASVRPADAPVTEPAGRDTRHSVFGLADFFHVEVDSSLAARANDDAEAGRASLVALGRPLEAGDFLVLVGVNFATKEIEHWLWGTLWWHDRAGRGPFAADRPAGLPPMLGRYLLQVALDSTLPLDSAGGPHVCFNPWLEGRFPDGGQGSGATSNCLTCHQRASYPSVPFLPVTRGAADLAADPAYTPGRLRTGFLWSLALHSTR